MILIHFQKRLITSLLQDVPWVSPLDTPMSSRDHTDLGTSPPNYESQNSSGVPPTYAAFSPVTLQGNTPSRSARRSTVLVHQKSPLLLATPPQVTRALAYSHPFLLPLNTVAGLLTWSTGDTWQSFLLLCAFWAVVLYGDAVVKWAGPVAVAVGMILGMYGRRYSPLSTSGWIDPSKDSSGKLSAQSSTSGQKGGKANGGDKTPKPIKHQRAASEITNTKHQKTLDEIVETLKEFTGRCNTLMDPFLEMTDFLSTQRTPTSATTRPALIAMFLRLLVVTPFWIILSLPPWRVITTRRVILFTGTLLLSWHSRAMRVTRVVVWRSAAIRKLASAITGLHFETPAFSAPGDPRLGDRNAKRPESELTKALKKPKTLSMNHRRSGSDKSAGLKFTFIIYENQRRWVGLGWTNSLFAYERHAWTDEHNHPVPPKDEFELPEVEDGSNVEWRWVPSGRWRVDGVPDDQGTVDYDGDEGKNGWIYYDNKVRQYMMPASTENAANMAISGKMVAEDKTDGVVGQGEESGTETLNWLKSTLKIFLKSSVPQHQSPTPRLAIQKSRPLPCAQNQL